MDRITPTPSNIRVKNTPSKVRLIAGGGGLFAALLGKWSAKVGPRRAMVQGCLTAGIYIILLQSAYLKINTVKKLKIKK